MKQALREEIRGENIVVLPHEQAETGVTAGTIILTLQGEKPVEALRPGDRIVTRDSGAQPLRAIRAVDVSRRDTLRIDAAALDKNRPDCDMIVAAEQPILLRDWLAKALYGQASSMTPARCLIDGEHIAPVTGKGDTRLYQLCFDTPHVIYAGGLELASSALTRETA